MKKTFTLFLVIFLNLILKSQLYNNVANYAITGTPQNGIKIKTSFPYLNEQMPTIILEGYAYGTGETIGLIINYYVYNNEFYRYSSHVSSFGTFRPKIILANENGKVVIYLDSKVYYMRFSVRTFGIEASNYYQNWTIVDETLTGQNQYVLPYKDQISVVNGNVGIGNPNPEVKLDVAGSLRAEDFVSGGRNSYIFHTPDDGRKALYIAPKIDNSTEYDWNKAFTLNNGNASLLGKLEAKEVKVTTTPTADFVFAEDYKLPSLNEVEKHIKEKRHLPEIASAKEMEKEGVNIGEFQIKLLQKIEELTLYIIEQEKRIKALEKN